MSRIIHSNTCPNCNSVIFSFDYDKEKQKYVCKSCNCEFTPKITEDDTQLDAKDRICGFMNQSNSEFTANRLQGKQDISVVEERRNK